MFEEVEGITASVQTCVNHAGHAVARPDFNEQHMDKMMQMTNPNIPVLMKDLGKYMTFLKSVSRLRAEAKIKSEDGGGPEGSGGRDFFDEVPGELPSWEDMPAFTRMLIPLATNFCLLLDTIVRGYIQLGDDDSATPYKKDKENFLQKLYATGDVIRGEGRHDDCPHWGRTEMQHLGWLVLSTAHSAGATFPSGSDVELTMTQSPDMVESWALAIWKRAPRLEAPR